MALVTAKFAFILPFYIKILGEYGNKPQSLKTDSEEIVIYAPALNGPSLSVESAWSPTSENIIGKIGTEPVWEANRILIDIKRDFSTTKIAEEDQKALVNKARDILYKILILYRWRGKQLQIDVSDIEKFNYHVAYYDAADTLIGQPTGTLNLVINLLSGSLESYQWNDVCEDLVSGAMPELYESLLLDARSVVSKEPRRAVLDATTACEVFIKNFCDNASQNNPEIDPVIYSALSPRSTAVLSYFHQVLKYLFKNSLKEKLPNLYKELGYLVDTNNNVKHEGRCYYRITKKNEGVDVPVDSARARKFIKAVEEAIQYTKSLGC